MTRRLFFLFSLLLLVRAVYSQDAQQGEQDKAINEEAQTNEASNSTAATAMPTAASNEVEEVPSRSFHQVIKEQFIAGDWRYMSTVLLCLILGLGIAFERIITLSFATTNTTKLLKGVEDVLNTGGVEAAKTLCKNTRGPVASIFAQGLMRSSEGVEAIEKSITSYGSVEMGKLERGMVWISLFISLAPMLGFLGTVVGMVNAFDAIAVAGDVSPSLVADGIKIALITTVGGLIVAIILQLFYNYLVAKIDALVNAMEDASISLVDLLIKQKNEIKQA